MVETLSNIFSENDWGVYALLAYFLFKGATFTRPQTTSIRTFFILPLILTILLWNLRFPVLESIFYYSVGFGGGFFFLRKEQIQWDIKTKKIQIPRSLSLAILLSFYCSAYYTHLLEIIVLNSIAGVFLGHSFKLFLIKKEVRP